MLAVTVAMFLGWLALILAAASYDLKLRQPPEKSAQALALLMANAALVLAVCAARYL